MDREILISDTPDAAELYTTPSDQHHRVLLGVKCWLSNGRWVQEQLVVGRFGAPLLVGFLPHELSLVKGVPELVTGVSELAFNHRADAVSIFYRHNRQPTWFRPAKELCSLVTLSCDLSTPLISSFEVQGEASITEAQWRQVETTAEEIVRLAEIWGPVFAHFSPAVES